MDLVLRRVLLANLLSIIVLAGTAIYLLCAVIALPAESADGYLQMITGKTDAVQVESTVKGIVQVTTNNFHAARTLLMAAVAVLGFQTAVSLAIRRGLRRLENGTPELRRIQATVGEA